MEKKKSNELINMINVSHVSDLSKNRDALQQEAKDLDGGEIVLLNGAVHSHRVKLGLKSLPRDRKMLFNTYNANGLLILIGVTLEEQLSFSVGIAGESTAYQMTPNEERHLIFSTDVPSQLKDIEQTLSGELYKLALQLFEPDERYFY